jgi:hypothetical protein
MQIYELTSGTKKSQLDEGIWDGVRQAFSTDPKLSGLTATQRAAMLSRNRKMLEIGKKARDSWEVYARQLENTIRDPAAKTVFQQRTDGKYENALRAFVQKNMLPKYVRYNNLSNARDIDDLIKEISAANTAPAKQTQLWNQLTQQSAMAQTAPEALSAAPTGTATPAAAPVAKPTAAPAAATTTPTAVNPADILNITASLGIKDQMLKNLGQALRQVDTANVGTTGNAAVDELLKAMGL